MIFHHNTGNGYCNIINFGALRLARRGYSEDWIKPFAKLLLIE